ncbi:MAG: TIGR04372 family glycosyltransferase [Thalassobaculaceae bacterium]|nr:TIGR04372 family glycosyltransferase [Thalassobaculaceae bacterium]
MLPLDFLRQFIIQHAGDDRMIARRILLAIYRGEVTHEESLGLLKFVFRLAHFVTVFEYLAVFLIATGGRLPDGGTITNAPRSQALFTPFAVWLKQCLVDGELSMPPVNETQGMVFVSTMLDGVEAHLLSLRAKDEALRVAELRRMIDEIWRNGAPQWVLSSTFSSNIGHFAYAATLLTLQNTGYIAAPPIIMLKGHTRNRYLQGEFERHMIDAMPPGITYAEMISARKRYSVTSGGTATMSELVSETARRWTGGTPFLEMDPDLSRRGNSVLSDLGAGVDDPVATIHVREEGYNANVSSTMRLRDAHFETYGVAIRRLVEAGFKVVRLGDPSMKPASPIDGLIDYPFTTAKSDWMDIYLAGRCAFHIGTSSGMSFIPLLFGRPVLFTNFPTLAQMVCAPSVVTLPKVLQTEVGETVPFETYCRDHADILEASDAIIHGLVFTENTPEDIAQGAAMMVEHLDRDTGRMVLPDALFSRARSALPTHPQIPNWFLERHYSAGSV